MNVRKRKRRRLVEERAFFAVVIRSALRGFLVMSLDADRGINGGWPVSVDWEKTKSIQFLCLEIKSRERNWSMYNTSRNVVKERIWKKGKKEKAEEEAD